MHSVEINLDVVLARVLWKDYLVPLTIYDGFVRLSLRDFQQRQCA
jgi:hypothetical protein